VGRDGACGFFIRLVSTFDGTLATACLDFHLYVRGRIRAVPGFVLARLCVGTRVDFLVGVRRGEFEGE
jgi:hypothetical protein